MLSLTEKDRLTIQKNYYKFLLSLKENLKNKGINSSLDCYVIIVNLLKSGRFSYNGKMKYLATFDYLDLPNMDDGAQVMYGVGCCRHINLLINDIMKMLGFDVSLLYVKTDETDIWHRATLLTANHVVVTLKDHDEYLLDAYNNFVFKIVGNDLEPVEIKNNSEILMNEYPDDNIKEIGLILKKYYNMQASGIEFVYDYGY